MLRINFTPTHAQLHIKKKQWGMNLLSRGAATMRRRVSMQEAEGDEMIQINIVYRVSSIPAKLFTLGYLLFCRLLVMQNAKVRTFFKKLGNLLHDRHKNFEIRFRNS